MNYAQAKKKIFPPFLEWVSEFVCVRCAALFCFQLYLINNTSCWISFNCFIVEFFFLALFSSSSTVRSSGFFSSFCFYGECVLLGRRVRKRKQHKKKHRDWALCILLVHREWTRRTRHAATIKRFIVFDNCTLKVFEFVLLCVVYHPEQRHRQPLWVHDNTESSRIALAHTKH